jgi:type IV secretory pathway VirB4 component
MANDPKTNSKSTQASLLISEIKDGVVVLRDGSMRAVVLASAINFDLMSQKEQDGIEYAYQGFLNSLHFPIQIVVRSQKLDLDSYIDKLKGLRQTQDNELLAALMDDYIANIQALVEEVNIMDKQFYVVVPFFPPVQIRSGFMSNLKQVLSPAPTVTVGEIEFQQSKAELAQRVQQVASGLTQLGVQAIPLNTQELVDLYYTAYNPDVAANQKLIEAGGMQTAVVTRGDGPNPNGRPTLPGGPV